MTACTNKARGAVVAALAGVLALGAVPAVALATGTADAQVNLLVSDAANAFSKGEIAFDIDGTPATVADNKCTVSATGSDLKIDNVTVTPEAESTPIAVSGDKDYEVKLYAADEDGDKTGAALDAIKDPGTYVIEITAVDGNYVGGVATATLTVNANPFTGISFRAYEVDPDNPNVMTDTKFMYTGSEIEVGVMNKKDLVEGEDYEVKILKAGSKPTDAEATVLDAGNYVAYVTGIGAYAGAESQTTFEVVPFNFNNADIITNDVIADGEPPAHPSKVVIKSSDADYVGTELDPSLVDITCDKVFSANGKYNFTSSYDKDDENLTGTAADTSVNKVGKMATFEYDGEAVQDEYVFDKSKDEAFDIKKMVVSAGDDELKMNNEYTVKVTKGGKTVAVADMKYAGTYKVTVTVDPAKVSPAYSYGGSVSFTVKVTAGTIDADASIYVTYDGKVVSSVEKNYDGTPIRDSDFVIKAVDEDGKKVTVKSALYDAEGNKVSEAEDAGEYTLKITSNQYDLTGTTEVPITINKLNFTQIKLGCLSEWSGSEFVPMERAEVKDASGNVVVSAIDELTDWASYGLTFDTGFQAANPDADNDGKGWDGLETTPFWNATYSGKLGRDYIVVERYDADKGEWVEVADKGDVDKAEGNYRLTVSAVDSTMEKNYEFANAEDHSTTIEFKVADVDKINYTDVTPDDWFFNCVDWMSDRNLIRGYADTDTFGPNNQITRDDVAVILFRMAQGSDTFVDPDLGYTENVGWVTGFSDIDEAGLGNMYYARAVAWAKASGVVSGCDDGTFGPYDQITREQLATMLANYAKVVNRDEVSLVEGELDAMPDGGSVSVWAEKAVSWCLENEQMGNDGTIRPSDTITRAETAAMAYNYLAKVVGLK